MRWFRRRSVRLYDHSREARLLPEYASLYPGLKPDRWYAVTRLAKRVGCPPGSALREIIHSHFEFQGGLQQRNPAWPFLRQREDDLPVALSGAGERLGRLRYDYAQLYHPVRPEQWLPARDLRDQVVGIREQEREASPGWTMSREESAPSGRTLPDEHFEFRSGMSDAGMPRLRTRRDDFAIRRRGPGGDRSILAR